MFSITESLKYGWEKFKGSKGVWAATLAMLVLTLLSNTNSSEPMRGFRYQEGITFHHPSFGLVSILAFIALLVARVGYTKLLLKVADGENFDWPQALENTFNTHKVFWRFIGVSVLYGILALVGFILLIIPGFFVISAYFFSTLIVIDTGMRPIAALKESLAITKGSRLKILGFIIVLGVFNMLGVIALGIGLFITIPVSMFATINIYRKLSSAKVAIVTTS